MRADFINGFLFWIRGWRHIMRHRSLLSLAMLPLFIVTVAAGFLIFTLWSHLPLWAHALILKIGLVEGFWFDVLYYPLLFSMGFVLTLFAVYVMYLAQNLLAQPFYGFLADRTLTGAGKKANDQFMWNEWARHTVRMIRVSLVRTLVLLTAGAFLFLFSFFPPLNILAGIGLLLILASDCMDYALEALGYGLRRRVAYFLKYWAQWFGMAAGLALTMVIPGLTLLVIPGAVVGAALIVKSESK